MSWLLKQAEDILNRVDQQTNAALRQHNTPSSSRENLLEIIPESPTFPSSLPVVQPVVSNRNIVTPTRRLKKTDDNDLINYLNSPTSVNNNETKQPIAVPLPSSKRRTSSSSTTANENLSVVSGQNSSNGLILNISPTDETFQNGSGEHLISKLQCEIQALTNEKLRYEAELQTYKRQQVQFQHQISESDALLCDLRTRENDFIQVLTAKDSQITLLRSRLNEADEALQRKTLQYDELQGQYSHLIDNSSQIPSVSFDSLQTRKKQLEHELERSLNENERLNNEKDQLIEQLRSMEKTLTDEHLQLYEQQQQTKLAKALANQLEYDLNEYKSKAQRILQAKEKLIHKLQNIAQHRSSTPSVSDQSELESLGVHEDSTLLDVSLVGNNSQNSSSNWASMQFDDLKCENDLFKQELQTRESTIHRLRNDLQEAELILQQSEEQSQDKLKQLNGQLNDKHARLTLVEQDYQKLKHELTSVHDEYQKQKQVYQGQLAEREREIERLRLQLTSKTINNVNYDELEKRLQTLTESVIHKQTIIETLQMDKSSLKMQLERLEKRLDDYETITARNSQQQSSRSAPTTSISMDETEHYENLRYRMPLLRETPYDVHLTKKVKRAANELDQLGIRLTILLRRYPAVRLGFLFYALILHLWTFIVLFTYTPEAHGNGNSLHLKDKL